MAQAEPDFPLFRVLHTPRLTLLAANKALLQADLKGPEALGLLIKANVGDQWPPELYDRATLEYALRQLDDPAGQGWSLWYLLTAEPEIPTAIGIGAFKGRPDASGSVEVIYSILGAYRNQGFASEAVSRLVEWAFSHHNVNEVSAEVMAHLEQSKRVLLKCGFIPEGVGSERGVVRYAVHRPDRR